MSIKALRTSRGRRRGVVLITMALAAAAIFGVVGLAVDIGRMFIVKGETQAYCDAAALAAALALDGNSTGIALAQAAVAGSPNRWHFATASVANPSLTFATSAAGPWLASPNPAAGYTYARVTASAPAPLYFLPLVVEANRFNVVSSATAAQIPIASLSRGISPYTAVSTAPVGPDFGFVVGNSYDIQWPQYNASRANCGPANPDRCFNSPPCSGETFAAKAAVVANWGASTSGYWGGSSNSEIAAEVLDLVQLAPVAVGTNIQAMLAPGNKASQAVYLDERASGDSNTSDNTAAAYLASASRNGRRLLPVLIARPVSPATTEVSGYGQFLLLANGSPSNYYVRTTNGNDPFCAIYVGPYNIGSTGPAAGGTTGASRVALVQ